jgi:hypothetical protein
LGEGGGAVMRYVYAESEVKSRFCFDAQVGKRRRHDLNEPHRCYTQTQQGTYMTLFAKVFSTRTLMQIVVVLTATVAMKALSVHYDFSWLAALAAG